MIKEFNDKKIVAWIPHSCTYIPEVSDKLVSDSNLLSDTFVDKLYSFLTNKITSDYSRFMVDLERYFDDEKEAMSKVGMGMLYNRHIDGTPFDRSIFGEDDYFKNYYITKHTILKESIKSVGDGCILLDLHSFNNVPLPCDSVQTMDRPDICFGFNEDFTKPSDSVMLYIKEFCKEKYISAKFNNPYSGSMTVGDIGIKYTSLMIEINKNMYIYNGKFRSDAYKLSHNLKELIQGITELCK